MLVVVNQSHTNNFRIDGSLSPDFLELLKDKFGEDMKVSDDNEAWVDYKDTDWYKEISSIRTPAFNLAFYRKERRLTQAALAEKAGTQKQVISDMEHGRKGISKNMAKKLAAILGCSPEKFI